MRDSRIDYFKGVGVMCVVLIHSLPDFWLEMSGTEKALQDSCTWAVPAFLYCSGRLYRKDTSFSATRKRLVRILGPYVVATLFIWLQRSKADFQLTWRDCALELLLAYACGPYYYVFVIVCLVCIVPLLAALPDKLGRSLLFLCIAAQVYHKGVDPLYFSSFFWMLRSPVLWWGYFLTGWFEGDPQTSDSARKSQCSLPAPVYLLSLLLTMYAYLHWSIGIFGIGYNYAVLLATMRLVPPTTPMPAALQWLSENSYTIYLYHPAMIYAAREYVPDNAAPLKRLFCLFSVGLGGASVFTAIVIAIVKEHVAEVMFGVKVARASPKVSTSEVSSVCKVVTTA